MSIIKSGTIKSTVIVSSSVYSCNKCGHTEIADNSFMVGKKCPKCNENMEIISSQTESLPEEK
jgi:rubrerythrin